MELLYTATSVQNFSEAAFAIFENSFDCIVMYDGNKHVKLWNASAEKWFSKTKEEVLGRHVDDVFPQLRDDPRMAYLDRAINGEQFHLFQEYKTMSEGCYEQLIIPIENKKNRNGAFDVLIIARDTTLEVKRVHNIRETSRKLAEQNASLSAEIKMLRAAIAATRCRTAVFNDQLVCVEASRELQNASGLPAPGLVGMNLKDVVFALTDLVEYGFVRKAASGDAQAVSDFSGKLQPGRNRLHLDPLSVGEPGLLGMVLTVSADHEMAKEIERLQVTIREHQKQQKELLLLVEACHTRYMTALERCRQEIERFRLSNDEAHAENLARLNAHLEDMAAASAAYGQLYGSMEEEPLGRVELTQLLADLQSAYAATGLNVVLDVFALPAVSGRYADLYLLFDTLVRYLIGLDAAHRQQRLVVTFRPADNSQPKTAVVMVARVSASSASVQKGAKGRSIEAPSEAKLALCRQLMQRNEGQFEYTNRNRKPVFTLHFLAQDSQP